MRYDGSSMFSGDPNRCNRCGSLIDPESGLSDEGVCRECKGGHIAAQEMRYER